MKNMLIVLVVSGIFLLGCTNSSAPVEPEPDVSEPNIIEPNNPNEEETKLPEKPEQDNENEDEEANERLTIEEAADQIVKFLHDKDIQSLAEKVHPEKGVRFTPYGYVDENSDQVFLKNEIVERWEDNSVYNWGAFDGTGDPIELTFKEYYDEFVYDVDYIDAEEIAINERLGQGNTLDNSQQVYPEAMIVEYHFPGFEEQYEGMDWRSLRVVMEETNGQWYLVGLIHDEWTI
ncbi:hypothetical protein [Bacillus solitudinis]|uniref:hypothetical protein n=1 Tax=Bacillus solitudinis TaxID=2014074 RepID=UPI000C235BFB|nr:hypothetical protein [Bacillus solitudinis]